MSRQENPKTKIFEDIIRLQTTINGVKNEITQQKTPQRSHHHNRSFSEYGPYRRHPQEPLLDPRDRPILPSGHPYEPPMYPPPMIDDRAHLDMARSFGHFGRNMLPPPGPLFRQHSFQQMHREPPPHPLERNRQASFDLHQQQQYDSEVHYGQPLMLYQDPDLSLKDLPPREQPYEDTSQSRRYQTAPNSDMYIDQHLKASINYPPKVRAQQDKELLSRKSSKKQGTPKSEYSQASSKHRSHSVHRKESKRSKKSRHRKYEVESSTDTESTQQSEDNSSQSSTIDESDSSSQTHSLTESEIISKYGESLKKKKKKQKHKTHRKDKNKVYKKVIIIADGQKNVLKDILSSEYQGSDSTKIKAGSQTQENAPYIIMDRNSQLRKLNSVTQTNDTRSSKSRADEPQKLNEVVDLNENNLKQFQQEISQSQYQQPNHGLTEQQFQVISSFLKNYPVDDSNSLANQSRKSHHLNNEEARSVDHGKQEGNQDVRKVVNKVLQYYRNAGETHDKEDQLGDLNKNLEQLLKELRNEKQELNMQDIQELIQNNDILGTHHSNLSQQQIAEQNSVVLMALNPLFAQQNENSNPSNNSPQQKKPERFSQKYQTPTQEEPKQLFKQEISPKAKPKLKSKSAEKPNYIIPELQTKKLQRSLSGIDELQESNIAKEQLPSRGDDTVRSKGSRQSVNHKQHESWEKSIKSESDLESMDSSLLLPSQYLHHNDKLRQQLFDKRQDQNPGQGLRYQLRKQSLAREKSQPTQNGQVQQKEDRNIKGTSEGHSYRSQKEDVQSVDEDSSINDSHRQNKSINRSHNNSLTRQQSQEKLKPQKSFRSSKEDSSTPRLTKQKSLIRHKKSNSEDVSNNQSKASQSQSKVSSSQPLTKTALIQSQKIQQGNDSKGQTSKQKKIVGDQAPVRELASKWQKTLRLQGNNNSLNDAVGTPQPQIKQISFQQWRSQSSHGLQRTRSSNDVPRDSQKSSERRQSEDNPESSWNSRSNKSPYRNIDKEQESLGSKSLSRFQLPLKKDPVKESPEKVVYTNKVDMNGALARGLSIDMKSKFKNKKLKDVQQEKPQQNQSKVNENVIHQSLSQLKQLDTYSEIEYQPESLEQQDFDKEDNQEKYSESNQDTFQENNQDSFQENNQESYLENSYINQESYQEYSQENYQEFNLENSNALNTYDSSLHKIEEVEVDNKDEDINFTGSSTASSKRNEKTQIQNLEHSSKAGSDKSNSKAQIENQKPNSITNDDKGKEDNLQTKLHTLETDKRKVCEGGQDGEGIKSKSLLPTESLTMAFQGEVQYLHNNNSNSLSSLKSKISSSNEKSQSFQNDDEALENSKEDQIRQEKSPSPVVEVAPEVKPEEKAADSNQILQPKYQEEEKESPVTKSSGVLLSSLQKTMTNSALQQGKDQTIPITGGEFISQRDSAKNPMIPHIFKEGQAPIQNIKANQLVSPRLSETSTQYSLNSSPNVNRTLKPPLGVSSLENSPASKDVQAKQMKKDKERRYLELPKSQYLTTSQKKDQVDEADFIDTQRTVEDKISGKESPMSIKSEKKQKAKSVGCFSFCFSQPLE